MSDQEKKFFFDTSELLNLPGMNPARLRRLHALHIHTFWDLLWHLPLRYEDKTRIVCIQQLMEHQKVLVCGRLMDARIEERAHSRHLVCRIQDPTGVLLWRFFHFSNAQTRHFMQKCGTEWMCFGLVRRNFSGAMEMIHPEYTAIQKPIHPPGWIPIYFGVKGRLLNMWHTWIDCALAQMSARELLPSEYTRMWRHLSFQQALFQLHRPDKKITATHFLKYQRFLRQRLAFEELMAHRLLTMRHKRQREQYGAYALTHHHIQSQLLNALSFSLTQDQQAAVAAINQDLARTRPMLRLIQGDVGSGKTVLAACALAQAVASGTQACVMAPTELLARQHYQTLCHWFVPLGMRLAFISSSQTRTVRQQIVRSLVQHEIDVLIGTHALIQKDVHFAQLSLLVVDEQHRFGVLQRHALFAKGSAHLYPHQLMLTATPIPRTLSVIAHLDTSILRQLPPGRIPIRSALMSNARRSELLERVGLHCRKGEQVYWVCGLIEDSETQSAHTVHAVHQELKQAQPTLQIGCVHGRMKSKEKEDVMQAFSSGLLSVLIATTVIEVGVDVPNATLMIIENAERFGLSQLHQLRGRIGRGILPCFCVFLYQKPLSILANQRLKTIRAVQDGFQIAEEDLKLRGSGEVLGTRQSGQQAWKSVLLEEDEALVSRACDAAHELYLHHPEQAKWLIERWLHDTISDEII